MDPKLLLRPIKNRHPQQADHSQENQVVFDGVDRICLFFFLSLLSIVNYKRSTEIQRKGSEEALNESFNEDRIWV